MPLPAGAAQSFNPASLPTCAATVWGGAACSGPKSARHCPHQDQGCTPDCSVLPQAGSGKEGNLAMGLASSRGQIRQSGSLGASGKRWALRVLGSEVCGPAGLGRGSWWLSSCAKSVVETQRSSGLWYFGGRTRGSGVDGGNKTLWGARRWSVLPTVRYPGAQGCQGHAIQGFRGWGVGSTHRGLHHQPRSAGAGS